MEYICRREQKRLYLTFRVFSLKIGFVISLFHPQNFRLGYQRTDRHKATRLLFTPFASVLAVMLLFYIGEEPRTCAGNGAQIGCAGGVITVEQYYFIVIIYIAMPICTPP